MTEQTKTTPLSESIHYIKQTYDQLGYFDLYGWQVVTFIIITACLCLIVMYCQIMKTKDAIADDWVNQRCKPQNIPFAGWISKPEGQTAFEYTKTNFEYCIQNMLLGVTSASTSPLQYMLSALTKIGRAHV